jgi:hypothetical protein
MLERMRRGYTREAYDELVGHARQLLPAVALSTDMIVGFCGGWHRQRGLPGVEAQKEGASSLQPPACDVLCMRPVIPTHTHTPYPTPPPPPPAGETEEEHAASLELMARVQYDNAFLFAYSEREKTHASRHLADDVPQEVKSRRLQVCAKGGRGDLVGLLLDSLRSGCGPSSTCPVHDP